jgi:protein-disulfide isomerase
MEATGTPTVIFNGVYPGSPPDSTTLERLISKAMGDQND